MDRLWAAFGAFEFCFPFVKVESMPAPGLWTCAGMFITTAPMEEVHPMRFEGAFFPSEAGPSDPAEGFDGTSWDLMGVIVKYFRQVFKEESREENCRGMEVSFVGVGFAIFFPNPQTIPPPNRLPQMFAGYRLVYNVVTTGKTELASHEQGMPADVGHWHARFPVLHCGDQVKSHTGQSTLGAAMIHRTTKSWRIMGAAHGFAGLGDVALNEHGVKIGTVTQYYRPHDIVLIKAEENFDFDSEVYHSEGGLEAPAGEILECNDIPLFAKAKCHSWASGLLNFGIVDFHVKVEGSGTLYRLQRLIALYPGINMEIAPSVCGAPVMLTGTQSMLGLFWFQSQAHPLFCYVKSAEALKKLGWDCAGTMKN
ncbi:hypothetical protein BJ508DRAFT_346538 [Ascobolus immersus RN42]|uniref:Uncharacterized protein n=1 Tax=Ascobolus immersus RN42 TaxID=1160509 RepID=A0A3N4ILJ3_ASCIM|nr:hypothetical protein BJ508DRAFT_346538 [Ascobolus immersus RN42]